MSALFSSSTFLVALTLVVYVLAGRVYRATALFALHPVLVSTLALIAILRLARAGVGEYLERTSGLSFFLGPSVVALGVTVYRSAPLLRARWRSLLVSVPLGSATGLVSVVALSRALGASPVMAASLAPKSVTTPIAMGISEKLGGIPSLTAAVVIAVGIAGSVLGPPLLRALRVTSPVAFGLAMGAAAHGLGTARALEQGEAEGAASALSVALSGAVTALLAPLVMRAAEALVR